MDLNVSISRAAIKANAKKQMLLTKPHVCIVGLVYYVIMQVLGYLGERVSGADLLQEIYSSGNPFRFGIAVYPQSEQAANAIQRYWDQVSLGGTALSLALELVSIVIAMGFLIYALNVSRTRHANVGTLFDGFTILGRTLLLYILMGVFIFLWSLLLIIPGIIASYRYRLAPYLLVDHPEMSPMACIRESKRLMYGHKSELFVLDLSFIGWALLCVIPFAQIWIGPYMAVTYANYYQAVIGLQGAQGGTPGQPLPWEL